ncbi:acyltransferase [Natrialba sp. SSL1]|uniref:acyltransferase n=1 Tax=Natrialba sp. SSL1 TaxID=1869245 RepID=UPI0008F97180|nr:acyltransferase [Natrialba sp. SSL1]OIB56373.1 acyltransferase [Natrialba sp. SSL1]
MSKRIYSLDSMRIIAMGFVVAIHTNLFRGVGTYGDIANFVIDSTGRFVVPFFFLTSGYLFALKTLHRDPTLYVFERVRTIASLYVFGLLLAAPVFLVGSITQTGLDDGSLSATIGTELAGFLSPANLLYYGDSVSVILWFLPALAFSLMFVYGFVRFDKTSYLLPVSITFHVVGLFGASYTMLVDVPFEVRDALFFGFFYTSAGYILHRIDWHPSADRSRFLLGATALFAVVHVAERYALGYVLPGSSVADGVYTASYTIGTALVTISLFLFLLSRPTLSKNTPLPSWGKYAVGIYVVHPAVLYPLERLDQIAQLAGYDIGNTLLWHLTLTPAVFGVSLLIYIGALKVGAIEGGRVRFPRILPFQSRQYESN